MDSIFNPATEQDLVARLNLLMPQSKPQWGRMSVTEMLAHQVDVLRYALGEGEAQPVSGPMSRWPVNWLVVNLLPWPKGKADAPPEFLERPPREIAEERAELEALLHRCARRGPAGTWPISPAFGKLSGRSWGVLIQRHCDHHLRQFGV